jgi:hypothetical protein
MGILDKIIGGSVAEPIKAIGDVFDKLFTSDDERAQAQFVLEKLKQHPDELQIELNKIEATHRSIFVAGWRPAIGWICGISLGFYFIPQFILGAYLWIKMCLLKQILLPYPIDGKYLMDLIIGMLGLGVLRTVEKIKDKASK